MWTGRWPPWSSAVGRCDDSAVQTGADLGGLAGDVRDLFEDVFAATDGMRAALARLFDAGPVAAAAVVALLQAPARARLAAGFVAGCGYVAARDALADHALYLAWWQGEGGAPLGDAGESAHGALDYTRRQWFRVPERTGRRHVTGPYVDYVCTDEYIVTISQPVLLGARMLGIVGADVLVETLEEVLLGRLREAGATLVHAQGRVLASADDRLAAGRLIDPAGYRERVGCGVLPLCLVRGPTATPR